MTKTYTGRIDELTMALSAFDAKESGLVDLFNLFSERITDPEYKYKKFIDRGLDGIKYRLSESNDMITWQRFTEDGDETLRVLVIPKPQAEIELMYKSHSTAEIVKTLFEKVKKGKYE